MDIKHGDIITLDNGDVVKISLEVISKKVTELVHGREYMLKNHGSHCHTRNSYGEDYSSQKENLIFQYVGKTESSSGERYIFFAKEETVYSMWSTNSLDFVVREV